MKHLFRHDVLCISNLVFWNFFILFYNPSCFADDDNGILWWLVVDTTENFSGTSFMENFESSMGTSSRIVSLAGEKCSKNSIQRSITKIRNSFSVHDRLIFLFRGQITTPNANNQIHFVLRDDDLISGQNINRWLEEVDSTVLLDCITQNSNLGAFYANRQQLGQSAIVSVLSGSTGMNSSVGLIVGLKALFDDPSIADIDDNRQLTISEIYETLLSRSFHSGVFVPTGDLEKVLFKLPAMVKISGSPTEVSVMMNGTKVGQTELRLTDKLDQMARFIELHKSGYQLQKLILPKISIIPGQQNSISYQLEPIPVRGRIESLSSIGSLIVEILGTDYQRKIEGTDQFIFDDWTNDYLEVDKSYTILAKGNQRHYGAVSFIYQGVKPIDVRLNLTEKNWFQLAQMLYDLSEYQDAIQAFQSGIEVTLDFPSFSDSFTSMLFNSFLDVMGQADLPATYLVVMGELATRTHKPDIAKKYLRKALKTAERNSEAYKLAGQKLQAFYLIYYYLLASIIILSLLLVFVFFRKGKRRSCDV